MTAPTDVGVDNAVVTWLDPVVTDNSGEPLIVVCNPASGSTFPLDVVTTVTCTVFDEAGNSAACDFTVTVVGTFTSLLNVQFRQSSSLQHFFLPSQYSHVPLVAHFSFCFFL